MIDISIVIVNYNVKDLLIQCLRSIYLAKLDAISFEVIIVDNDSKDDSVSSVKLEFPEVLIIENKFNAGFSGGNNQGMAISKGSYIFLLNPDTEIVGNALFDLKSYADTHPNYSIVGPQLLNSDQTIQVSVWKNHKPIDLMLETFYLHKLFNFLNYPFEQLTKNFEVKTLSGAALFFRRSLIEKIGGLDEKLFWMEDIDFCFRAAELNPIMYLHSVQILHHSGQSQKKNYNVAISNQLISKLKYYKKHSASSGYWLAIVFCFVFIFSRLIIFGLLSPIKTIWSLKAKAYYHSFGRFYNYLFFNDTNIA